MFLVFIFNLKWEWKSEGERREKSDVNYIIYVIRCEFFRSHEADPQMYVVGLLWRVINV